MAAIKPRVSTTAPEIPTSSQGTPRTAPLAPDAPEERRAAGRARRAEHPRDALAQVPDRVGPRDPMAWLIASNAHRVPEIVPLRHARMRQSPFAFYRGAAAIMAHDLAGLAHSHCQTQLCGDAHLSNFGFFASPERTLLFDINDFDETAPGPFDWDLRRLAASFVIAARDIGLSDRDADDAVSLLADAYRDRLRRFARMDTFDLWTYRLTPETLIELGDDASDELAVVRKARRSTARVFAENAVEWGIDAQGQPCANIIDRPPFVYHDADATTREIARFRRQLDQFLASYAASLAPERRQLFARYRLHDVAVMTPGVGSVGRRCFLLLFMADGSHPLFLQCKEAGDSVLSVLDPQAAAAADWHDGERIVRGQRLMQSASDIFLGWAGTRDFGEFYVRQLRDMKASYDLTEFDARDLIEYAETCGYALARAHAKAGDPWPLVGWIGRNRSFNRALVRFARGYADLNEADWRAHERAIDEGRIVADT
jgi:hypothetical protein